MASNQAMTLDQWSKIMAVLLAAYPGIQHSPATFELYFRALNGAEPGRLESAVRRHILLSKFFPTIAELRNETGLNDTGHPSESEALEQARGLADAADAERDNFGRQGSYQSVTWPLVDPLVSEAFHQVGFDRKFSKPFLDAYKDLTEQELRQRLEMESHDQKRIGSSSQGREDLQELPMA